MTHVCCPRCRLRFPRAAASQLVACPVCGEPPATFVHGEQALGFRLARPDDSPEALLVAVSAAIPVPDPPEPLS
jgi:hypothetical protein